MIRVHFLFIITHTNMILINETLDSFVASDNQVYISNTSGSMSQIKMIKSLNQFFSLARRLHT